MAFRSDEALLALAEENRPSAFDALGEAFKLAAETWRINLAYLFDPMMAVHTSNIELLGSATPGQLQCAAVGRGSWAVAGRRRRAACV